MFRTLPSRHVTKICSAAFYHLYNIRRMRKFLNKSHTETLIHAFVTCRLDYCNSLLYGLPDTLISKLQRVQNACVRLVYHAPKQCHITPLLQDLHWLPVKMRIIFKILSSHLKLFISWLHHIFLELITLSRLVVIIYVRLTMAFCYHTLVVNQRKRLVIDRSCLLRQHYGTAFQPRLGTYNS
jgi:hypothetical protein